MWKENVSVLGDFSQCTAFFTEIDDDTYATLETVNASSNVKNKSPSVFTFLGGSYTFFHGVCKVWFASANIRTENIRTVACGEKKQNI